MARARGLEVGLIVAASVAIVGLVSGVRGSDREVRSYVAARPPPQTQVDAPGYVDLRTRPAGRNASLSPAWWSELASRRPDLFAPVVQTAEDRERALAARAARRAYDGAPPTIPHRIDQLGVPACLACHDAGLAIDGTIAPRMSHAPLASCVQCHVVSEDPRPVREPAPVVAASTFVGLGPPGPGARAWAGAPPTIPHSTRMRDRCDACHGPTGALGMRTTHPWRSSCTQCHAPSAVIDQRAPAALGGATP